MPDSWILRHSHTVGGLHLNIVRKRNAIVFRKRGTTACVIGKRRRESISVSTDVKPIGSGVSELRIDYGPGYRVYFVQRGRWLIEN